MKRLRNVPLRVWAIVPITLLFSAATVRLAWMIPFSVATVSKVVLGLAIAVALSGLVFLITLLARPGSRKLKSQPVRIGISVNDGSPMAIAWSMPLKCESITGII